MYIHTYVHTYIHTYIHQHTHTHEQALQAELGLDQKADTPIVAFIGRLAPQKGVDLIEQVLKLFLFLQCTHRHTCVCTCMRMRSFEKHMFAST